MTPDDTSKKPGRGGRRPGAGRPKGGGKPRTRPKSEAQIVRAAARQAAKAAARRVERAIAEYETAKADLAAGKIRPHRPSGTYTPSKVFERDKFVCCYCGAVTDDTLPKTHPQKATVDHIYPVAAGGDDDMANLTTACRDCNLRKNAGFWAEFIGRAIALQLQMAAR